MIRITSHITSHIIVFFWPCHVACGILVPQRGVEPVPPAVEVWSPNYWTTREFPGLVISVLFNNQIFMGHEKCKNKQTIIYALQEVSVV